VQALVKIANYHAKGFGQNHANTWFQPEWSGKQSL